MKKQNAEDDKNIESENTNLSDGGFLEEHDGVKILYLSGSYYQMGCQHGSLLKK